jgi:hypothetical protein
VIRRLFGLTSVVSFAVCAAAAVLWTATSQRGVALVRHKTQAVEYRLICGHGVAQVASVPYVRPTASPRSSAETTHLGCTIWRWQIDNQGGWAASVPLAYLIALFALLPVMRLSAWLRRKRRSGYAPALCRNCGYDLRAGHARCPECGAVPTTSGKPMPSVSQRPL